MSFLIGFTNFFIRGTPTMNKEEIDQGRSGSRSREVEPTDSLSFNSYDYSDEEEEEEEEVVDKILPPSSKAKVKPTRAASSRPRGRKSREEMKSLTASHALTAKESGEDRASMFSSTPRDGLSRDGREAMFGSIPQDRMALPMDREEILKALKASQVILTAKESAEDRAAMFASTPRDKMSRDGREAMLGSSPRDAQSRDGREAMFGPIRRDEVTREAVKALKASQVMLSAKESTDDEAALFGKLVTKKLRCFDDDTAEEIQQEIFSVFLSFQDSRKEKK